ncbi:MAG: phosphatase PAP2 family protein [Deltaproteobacteria bacterium]|nr:phosphatase PAP2 family protein [Deltaproteobacteria bacterium]
MLFLKYCRRGLGISISAAAIVVQLAGISVAEVNDEVLNKPASEAVTDSGQIMATQPAQPDRITAEYVKGYFSDSGRILASPVNWNSSDWLKTALVAGAASGLYFADADIKGFSQRNQSSAGDKVAAVGNALGNPFYTVPSLGLFYLYGHFNEDPKARRTSLLAVESLAISGVLTLTIKMATQRSRPSSGEASTTWDGPGFKNSDSSFPSLHTTSAFSIAAVFAEEYGSSPYVPPIAYGLAALTGLSRIYDNKHWASDAFFGGAIGYFVGKAVVRYHAVLSDTPLMIMPTVTKQGFGVMAEYRF